MLILGNHQWGGRGKEAAMGLTFNRVSWCKTNSPHCRLWEAVWDPPLRRWRPGPTVHTQGHCSQPGRKAAPREWTGVSSHQPAPCMGWATSEESWWKPLGREMWVLLLEVAWSAPELNTGGMGCVFTHVRDNPRSPV